MKLNVMFTIAAVYGIVLGLALLIFAPQMATVGGLPSSSGALMTLRFAGVEELGLGIIAWLVRNADTSKARDGVALGLTIYFVLHALTSLYGQFTDTSTSLHWVMATIQGLIAVGLFITGKASMSKSAS